MSPVPTVMGPVPRSSCLRQCRLERGRSRRRPACLDSARVSSPSPYSHRARRWPEHPSKIRSLFSVLWAESVGPHGSGHGIRRERPLKRKCEVWGDGGRGVAASGDDQALLLRIAWHLFSEVYRWR